VLDAIIDRRWSGMTSDAIAARIRVLAIVGVAGVLAFALVCLAAQFLRTDLDWIAAPLSYYLTGAYGEAVIAAYVALAVALAALGAGFYSHLPPSARSAAPLLLFVVGALALAITALSEAAKAHGNAGMWEAVHLAAAETTFLCVTVAMLLQSWWLRYDARWRGNFAFAFAWALATCAALWIYALGRSLPRGLSQKCVIALILFWLGWAAIKLWRKAAR
jgi:hypothetical protein